MKEKIVDDFMKVYHFKDYKRLYLIESLDDGDINGRFKINYD